MTTEYLLERLKDEKEYGISGGIYNMLQVEMAYNSNHIEGSTLTHEQTSFIYNTHSLAAENARVDDVIEASNHFRCFDLVLENCDKALDEDFIKNLHYQLKTGTLSSHSREAVLGEYKKYANYVGNIKTSEPNRVHKDLANLLEEYNTKKRKNLDDILDFHARFEKIHPFYDGNGRVGRLLLLKECLTNNIVPFVIREDMKPYYIKGISEWQQNGEKGYLRGLCSAMQDEMLAKLHYFEIPYLQDGEARKTISVRKDTIAYIKSFLETSKETPSFIMLCGIPGSGKHEKAQKIISLLPDNTVYIRSTDYWEKYGEFGADIVFSEISKEIRKSLSEKKNVVYSATNLTRESRNAILTNCVDQYQTRRELYICQISPETSKSNEPYEKLLKMSETLENNTPNKNTEKWDYIIFSGEDPKKEKSPEPEFIP